MTTFGWLFLAGLATWFAGALELWLGTVGLALPAVGLVATMVMARHGPPARMRSVAVVTGVIAASLLEGAFFLLPACHLALASFQGVLRRAIHLESFVGLFLIGSLGAALQAGLLHVLRTASQSATTPDGAAVWVVGGFLSTGLALTLAEKCVGGAPALQHALARP